MSRNWFLLAVIIGAAPVSADAQSIYRCKSSNGQIVYQQTGCANSQAVTGVRTVKAADAAPRALPAPSATYGVRQASYPSNRNRGNGTAAVIGGQGVGSGQYAPYGETDRLGQRPTDRATKGRRNVAQDNRPYQRIDAPRMIMDSPRPGIITDQYGKQYQQQGKSNYVLDPQTGRMCFRSGQTLQCN